MDVVIVDDMQINLALLGRLIAQLGVNQTSSFLVPEEALAFCATQVPDLLIVDYLMPGLDGINFIRKFRALPGREDIPVLMVTASDERAVRLDALEAGANDFLSKPLDRTEFFARTRNMLAARKAWPTARYGWPKRWKKPPSNSSCATAKPSPASPASPNTATPKPASTPSAWRTTRA